MTSNVLSTTDLETLGELGIEQLGHRSSASLEEIHRLRRGPQNGLYESAGRILTLLQDDETGAVFWEQHPGVIATSTTPRRGWLSRVPNVVFQFTYDALKPNEVLSYLRSIDDKLTPVQGLHRLTKFGAREEEWEIVDIDAASGDKPALLFIHDVFGNCRQLLLELAQSPDNAGIEFVNSALRSYEVLLFDHPSISVSPILNAIDLARCLRNVSQGINVVAHGRGGLVARWWRELCSRVPSDQQARVVLVGVPLDGTSIASPDRLRNVPSFLANIGSIIGWGASLLPWAVVSAAFFKAASALTSAVANTPVIDAALAMIPGLAAMSPPAVSNAELSRLSSPTAPISFRHDRHSPHYLVIKSSYRPDDEGSSRIWRLFSLEHIGYIAAQHLVFQTSNDLLVDTPSMAHSLPNIVDICEFDETQHVHHWDYFRQKRTIASINDFLLA